MCLIQIKREKIMDRWVFAAGISRESSEATLGNFQNCRLYDGDQKTDFKDGTVTVTTHAIKFKNDSSSLLIVSDNYRENGIIAGAQPGRTIPVAHLFALLIIKQLFIINKIYKNI